MSGGSVALVGILPSDRRRRVVLAAHVAAAHAGPAAPTGLPVHHAALAAISAWGRVVADGVILREPMVNTPLSARSRTHVQPPSSREAPGAARMPGEVYARCAAACTSLPLGRAKR